MNPFLYLLNPVVFFALLFILLGGFVLTLRLVLQPDKTTAEALKKAVSERDTLEKETKALQEETARLKSELSLKTQMFEGLKGQYDELEKDYEKLAQKPHESTKDVPQIRDSSQPIPKPNTPGPKNTDTAKSQ